MAIPKYMQAGNSYGIVLNMYHKAIPFEIPMGVRNYVPQNICGGGGYHDIICGGGGEKSKSVRGGQRKK